MTTAREKFQALLRELFQFDCADLDFGIYRIMNHKRGVIEKFISTHLPELIGEELNRGALADQSQTAAELAEIAKQITETLGKETLDADGNLVKFQETEIGKKYIDLQRKAAGGRGREALEASIFNHLYTFFSRYYQDGDFISKRRYSKRQKYAIPYNGEEVYLYWANHDQYYVKTTEHFHNYRWKDPYGTTVHFKMTAANVEQNNVKGEKRFFLPRVKEIEWQEKMNELVIPFEYRPFTDQEKVSYGTKNQQDKIIAEACKAIPKNLKKVNKALLAISAERRKNSDGQPVTFLEHHLRQYTRKNTSDFFIHKDLKGFLSRELDFYLKNEVLNLDDMEAAGEDYAEGWFQVMRAVKAVGGRIIDFLDQIESFQKMLWEKRKFVTETHYCITVGNIDESFYPDIAACDAQWDEWKELFHIDEDQIDLFSMGKSKKERRLAFLKAHPTLVIDTKHFTGKFVDRLLASFDDVDSMNDGMLIHSENFQALAFLQERYRHNVECVHIDPPYNTATSGFLYKNDYQHSSWLAMMQDRIESGLKILNDKGSFLCHIDENEYERLSILFDSVGIPNAGTIIWDKRNPMTGGGGIATQHEYIIWRSWSEAAFNVRSENVQEMLNKAKQLIELNGGVNERARKAYAKWAGNNELLSGGEKAYRYIDDDGNVYQSVSLRAPEPRSNPKFFKPLLHPSTGKPCAVPPNGFSRTPETLEAMLERGEILFGPDHTTQPRQKYFLSPDTKRQLTSVIQNAKRGKADLDALGIESFPYSHSTSFYEELLGAGMSRSGGIVLDHFAGSGTTGHAVINLNRADASQRRFILVEMGDYFESVLIPRIKKVLFSPEWKNGKPKRMATQEEAERSPRIVKYLRLESYEDTLNNISFDDASGQQALHFDDYLLQYMLKWETRKSETLLNVEQLAKPFSYKLTIANGDETVEKVVDLPETFNYLLGLHVSTRKVYDDDGRRYLVYRGRIDHRQAAVIWRETGGWQKKDLERDKQFVAKQNLAEGADEVFVNGDSFIPNARALEPVFKARMFAPVEA